MLKIHQPYKSKSIFAFTSIGVLLLGSLIIVNAFSETSAVQAAGDSRTIHDISNMQDMTQQICSNTNIGDTETLIDRRGTNISYKVIKMLDGTCWMVENLRLIDVTIDSTNSDITSGSFTIPVSSLDSFSDIEAEDDIYVPRAYYDNDTIYGAYYSWSAATAGSGSKDINGTTGKNVASNSICPKGWKLPGYDGAGSFYNIIDGSNGYKSSWLGGDNAVNDTSGFILGYNSDNAFWPAAGYAENDPLTFPGAFGFYWSHVARDEYNAYGLGFSNLNRVYPQHESPRNIGASVRCVVDPRLSESKNSNITVTMPTVITIDAASGMQDTAEANKITEGTIIAKVTSNGKHEVLLSAAEPALKDPKVSTAEISPVSSTNPVQPGNNAWGIWNSNTKIYDPITEEAQTYDETITNGADSQKIHTYQVGISISTALPAGTYATEVTVTAAAK